MHAYMEALLKNILNLHFASPIVAGRRYTFILLYIACIT